MEKRVVVPTVGVQPAPASTGTGTYLLTVPIDGSVHVESSVISKSPQETLSSVMTADLKKFVSFLTSWRLIVD